LPTIPPKDPVEKNSATPRMYVPAAVNVNSRNESRPAVLPPCPSVVSESSFCANRLPVESYRKICELNAAFVASMSKIPRSPAFDTVNE
jgi:hypothetical protein